MLKHTHLHLKRLLYRVRRDYLTLNNVVIAMAVFIALSWTWSSIGVMRQNYELQQLIDQKKRSVELEKLRVATLELEGKYYHSLEYQELAVRERLGKGLPGEHTLIVPSTDKPLTASQPAPTPPQSSNFQEWMNFLFGGRR